MSDKSRKYRNDVFYEAWRRGVDPDWAADARKAAGLEEHPHREQTK